MKIVILLLTPLLSAECWPGHYGSEYTDCDSRSDYYDSSYEVKSNKILELS